MIHYEIQEGFSEDDEGNCIFKLADVVDRLEFGGEYDTDKFILSRGPTDMNSLRLMTANAVRGYVEAILKEHKLIT